MEIYLSESSFLYMILSVIEVYRKECLGLLYGHSCQDRVLIDLVIPHQTARRFHKTVCPNLARLKRVNEAVMLISQWEHLGFYHSHPDSHGMRTLADLSGVDLESMGEGQYEIIIALNEQRRGQCWRYLRNGDLAGSFAGLRFNFAAYSARERRKEHVPIVCPFALGFQEINAAALIDRQVRFFQALLPPPAVTPSPEKTLAKGARVGRSGRAGRTN